MLDAYTHTYMGTLTHTYSHYSDIIDLCAAAHAHKKPASMCAFCYHGLLKSVAHGHIRRYGWMDGWTDGCMRLCMLVCM